MTITDNISAVADAALDRSVVLGYTKLGSGLRRLWWPADPAPGSMAGRRVVVTGATAGIGEAMAGSFARLGATVHLLGRNAEKVSHSAGVIRASVPGSSGGTVIEEVCDVSDLDAVRTWTDDLAGRVDGLHGLVHNAGVMPKQRGETPQGHETQLACHVLGPHLMTERLLGLLRNPDESAVVFMSSGGMYTAPLKRWTEDELESRDGPYNGVRVYARTKRMQVVLADAWARRLARTGVHVYSAHPGWVETPGVADALPTFRSVTRPLLRDTTDGADTAVWLVATRPDSTPGHFWHDRAQRPTTFGWQRRQDPHAVAAFLDEVSAMTGTARSWVAI
ncbi:SDR family NAD(P)-dependent oxidoreductase [Mycobacterium sp. Y57]|uniref:SDR family NAD(P)-dependent oxidoreductase n=1 Tax=Mycolicibacterium xanthum TaxID=2796469 RepID=UPI001C848912|nr:SDR family NAD(P)-dependent oxidoreductase [Mycolicibacterium xanthum]MBX7432057.1 SDR family NAD(P)-dependent oxidoreductase [Mycolicibacterium xanthum]